MISGTALALVPIFMLIALGYVFKRFSFPALEFWPMMDRFTYYVLFPSLLVYKLSTAELKGVNGTEVVASVVIAVGVMLLLTLAVGKYKKIEKKAFTSVIQGAIRFNTYVFLALVDALLGDVGLVIAALVMAFAIPFINFLCIGAFSYFINKENLSVKRFVLFIGTNPLIIGCLIGGGLNILEWELPLLVLKTLSILSAAALAMGLLSVGVGLELSQIKSAKYELFLATGLKLLVFPLVMMGVTAFFALSKEAWTVLMIFASVPTASSCYILARQLGGDLSLMASIITVQTLLSTVTVAIFIAF